MKGTDSSMVESDRATQYSGRPMHDVSNIIKLKGKLNFSHSKSSSSFTHYEGAFSTHQQP